MCIECHPEFDRHPRIKRLIDHLPEDEATFCDAIALIDAETRTRIADDLRNSQTSNDILTKNTL